MRDDTEQRREQIAQIIGMALLIGILVMFGLVAAGTMNVWTLLWVFALLGLCFGLLCMTLPRWMKRGSKSPEQTAKDTAWFKQNGLVLFVVAAVLLVVLYWTRHRR